MAQYEEIKTMSAKMAVPLNSAGCIAIGGETVAGVKKMSLKGVSAQATLAQSSTVWETVFSNICGGEFDSLNGGREMSGGVVE